MTNVADQHWIVDSIEESTASIEIDGTTMITVPLRNLPRGVRQGHVLLVHCDGVQSDSRSAMSIVIDEVATKRALEASAAQVAKSQGQPNDPGGDVAL